MGCFALPLRQDSEGPTDRDDFDAPPDDDIHLYPGMPQMDDIFAPSMP